jgi:hypothetical protein
MHLPDLSRIQYHRGPCDADEWACPLLSVGWYEVPEELPRGEAPAALVTRLEEFLDAVRECYGTFHFRGLHQCTLCDPGNCYDEEPPFLSNLNLWVPATECVYLMPGLALHYLTAHGYLPPQDFIAAVMVCPVPGTEAYHEALRAANRGLPVPLRSPAETEADYAAMREEFRILRESRRIEEGGRAEGSGLHQG